MFEKHRRRASRCGKDCPACCGRAPSWFQVLKRTRGVPARYQMPLRMYPAQRRVQLTGGQESLHPCGAVEPRSLEIVERETRRTVSGMQLLNAAPAVPLRLELRKQPLHFAEVHPVRTRIRASILGVLEMRSHHLAHDVGQIADAVVLVVAPHVECL